MKNRKTDRRTIQQGGEGPYRDPQGLTLPGGDPGRASLGKSEFDSIKGAGGIAKVAGRRMPPPVKITPIWSAQYWMQKFPWAPITFYAREEYAELPTVAPPSSPAEYPIYTVVIPQNQTLIITSVVWRILAALVETASIAAYPLDYTFDWNLKATKSTTTRAEFQVTVSGSQPQDHLINAGASIGYYSRGYVILNRNILTPSNGGVIIAGENQALRFFALNLYNSVWTGNDGFFGVEVEGFFIPTQLYNKIKAQPSL